MVRKVTQKGPPHVRFLTISYIYSLLCARVVDFISTVYRRGKKQLLTRKISRVGRSGYSTGLWLAAGLEFTGLETFLRIN